MTVEQNQNLLTRFQSSQSRDKSWIQPNQGLGGPNRVGLVARVERVFDVADGTVGDGFAHGVLV
jgi:hypothetical protein